MKTETVSEWTFSNSNSIITLFALGDSVDELVSQNYWSCITTRRAEQLTLQPDLILLRFLLAIPKAVAFSVPKETLHRTMVYFTSNGLVQFWRVQKALIRNIIVNTITATTVLNIIIIFIFTQ